MQSPTSVSAWVLSDDETLPPGMATHPDQVHRCLSGSLTAKMVSDVVAARISIDVAQAGA